MHHNIIPIIRNFKRKPVITLINVIGLSTSLVLVIVLSVYCYSELTTDMHHPNNNRVFLTITDNGMNTPGILKDDIDMKIPGVKTTVRISSTWNAPVFQAEDGSPIVSDLIFADPGFFSLFTYNALEGNLSNALDNLQSVVITKALKQKLFGNELALGKTIKYNNGESLTVTGVIDEPEGNTFLSFSAITSTETKKILQPSDGEFKEWGWCNFQTFLLLDEHANNKELAQSIFSLYPEEMKKWIKKTELLSLKDIYFSTMPTGGRHYIHQGNKNKTLILLFVAGLILVIAIMNFINISSSQWSQRINNTGILKVIGASRFSIFKNLFFESFLLFLISVVISFVLLLVWLPVIKNFTGIHFNTQLITSPAFFLIIIVSNILLSFIFSLIPGLRISSSKAMDNLKKSLTSSQYNPRLNGGPMTLQMVISIVLISFTILVYKQISYGSDTLVFNQENTIAIKLTNQLKKDILKNQSSSNPQIQELSFTQFYPGKEIASWGGIILNLNGQEHKKIEFETFSADASFYNIMGLQLLQGHLYSNDMATSKNKVVVNEEFLKKNKISNPVGGTFKMNQRDYEIVGVIKNFHFKSYEKPIEALAITNSGYNAYGLAKIQASDFQSLHANIQEIKNMASKISPDFPVEISFLDDAVNKMYASEIRFRRTFSLFAMSAIVICALGLLAMSIFTAQKRVKEIGIRKVNGAKVSEVMAMLNKDFIKWVAIAFVIATPIAYYAMNKWLENFAYKTSLSWWVFALVGVLALGIALLTVSFQSYKAAVKNPVESLRYE